MRGQRRWPGYLFVQSQCTYDKVWRDYIVKRGHAFSNHKVRFRPVRRPSKRPRSSRRQLHQQASVKRLRHPDFPRPQPSQLQIQALPRQRAAGVIQVGQLPGLFAVSSEVFCFLDHYYFYGSDTDDPCRPAVPGK